MKLWKGFNPCTNNKKKPSTWKSQPCPRSAPSRITRARQNNLGQERELSNVRHWRAQCSDCQQSRGTPSFKRLFTSFSPHRQAAGWLTNVFPSRLNTVAWHVWSNGFILFLDIQCVFSPLISPSHLKERYCTIINGLGLELFSATTKKNKKQNTQKPRFILIFFLTS